MPKTIITIAALLLAGSTLAGCDLDFAEMEDFDSYHARHDGGEHRDRSLRAEQYRGDHERRREHERDDD